MSKILSLNRLPSSITKAFFLTLNLVVLSFFQQEVKAQEMATEITNIVPPDIEVAKLGTFGEFKQNLSIGQLEVNVPIHILDGLSLKYPINLSYNPVGIRVEERSTSIGMNWSQMGVGVITKTVIGKNDEQTSGYNSAYQYANQFQNSFYTPTDIMNDIPLRTSQGVFDLEPDYFSFNFNGRGGKFYFDPANGQYYTMPYSKLAITKSEPGEKGIFQIIDEKGYKYVFDRTSTSSNSYGSIGTGQDFTNNFVSQWYLSNVYAPDGNLEFSFEYLQGPMVTEQSSTSRTDLYLASSGGCSGGNISNIMRKEGSDVSFSNVSRQTLFLSKITCPMESASFYYKDRLDGSLRLDSISFSRNGLEKEGWRFFQGYYTGTNKLRLDSICQYSAQKKMGKYNFQYDPRNIPVLDSRSQDLWGFNNSKSNPTLIPKIWYNLQYIGDADRSPDLNAAKAGILTKISYPTGGSSEFVYELNDYGESEDGEANEPILAYTNQFLSRRYATEGAGSATLSFTLEKTEAITFTTYRDNCNYGSNNCSNDPTFVTITLTGRGAPISLNGPVKKNTTNTLSLDPGTYTVTIKADELQEYGQVSFQIPSIIGYSKKIAWGGLRIKKVINYDPITDKSSVRKFEYLVKGQPERSSGSILSKPNFTYRTSGATSCPPNGGHPMIQSCLSSFNYVRITSNSTSDLFFSDGSPIAYTRVVEVLGENGEGGSIEHVFSDANDLVIRAFPFPVPSSKSWKKGLPLQTNYITALGDTTSKEINEYYTDPRNFHQLVGYKAGLSAYCPYGVDYIRVGIGSMTYFSEWFYLKKNTKFAYGSVGQPPVESSTEYFYDNQAHSQVTKIQKKLSNGNYNVSYLKYPLDYAISNNTVDPASKALYKMQAKNMIEYPVEQTECVRTAGGEMIKKSDLVLYNEFTNDHIYDSKLYEYVSETPAVYTPLTTVVNGVFNFSPNYKIRYEAGTYNLKGKLVEFKNVAGLKKAVIYHSNGLLPIAIVTNAAANQIYFNGFEESTLPTMSMISKYGRKSNSQVYVVPGSVIVAGTYTKSWWERIGGEWVYNSVPFVHNGTDNLVFGSGNLIDNLAVYPPSAELQSFDYDLGEGLLNKVNTNGNGIQFKYDSLLRLRAVSDQNGNIVKSYNYHYKP